MNFTWDWNEWFMMISAIVCLAIYFPIRKFFHPIVTIIIWIFSIAFVESIDYFLAGSPFTTYYFSDNPTYEPSTVIFHLTVYPSFSLIFLYFYAKWQLRGIKFVWYLIFWTALSIFYEWICVLNRVLVYTGWKLLYSIPTYPISALILICLYHYIKKHLPTDPNQHTVTR